MLHSGKILFGRIGLLISALFIQVPGIMSQEHDCETVLRLKKAISEKMSLTKDSVFLLPENPEPKVDKNEMGSSEFSLRRMSSHGNEKFINPAFAPFYHGVASGDPMPDRVVIWTRVTPPDTSYAPISVVYKVSSTMDFSQPVLQGQLIADSMHDYTVKVDLLGLLPDTYYYYCFEAMGKKSITGRTKTTPTGQYNNLKIVLLTGSDYRRGYFTPLQNIAERNDIDIIFHSGDYIYEQGGGPPDRLHEPDAEIYRLQDYRTRISQYRLDTSLMRCHQLYPWSIIWDDHDIVVDAQRDTSFRHNSSAFGNYSARKLAAVKAFREWMPVRDDTLSYYKNWKKISFGTLADFFIIDERLYDRDPFAADIFDSLYNAPGLKMIGPEQLAWLTSGLAQSQAGWKIVGGGLMFSQLKVAGVPMVLENWDGYPYERNSIFDCIEQNQIDNVVFLSGDFHCSFASDVARNPYNPFEYNSSNGNGSLAVEFLPPALASENFDEGNDYGLGASNAGVAQNLIKSVNPHIRYVDLTGQGYVLLDITPQRAQGEFWFAQNILDPENTSESCAQIWKTSNHDNHLTETTHIAPPKPGVPAAPPFYPQPNDTLNQKDMSDNPIVLSCYPNPFPGYCYLNYVITSPTNIRIYISTTDGRVLENVLESKQSPGNYNIYINGKNLAKGVYLLITETDRNTLVRKLIKN